MSPIFEGSQDEFNTYRKKFKCIDNDSMIIWGDYNSKKAQQISIKFKMCEGGIANGCETKDNILEWLKGKFIVLLYNQIVFSSEDLFEEARKVESRISYIPISSQIR